MIHIQDDINTIPAEDGSICPTASYVSPLQKPNAVAKFLYCATSVWIWQFCFIKQCINFLFEHQCTHILRCQIAFSGFGWTHLYYFRLKIKLISIFDVWLMKDKYKGIDNNYTFYGCHSRVANIARLLGQ